MTLEGKIATGHEMGGSLALATFQPILQLHAHIRKGQYQPHVYDPVKGVEIVVGVRYNIVIEHYTSLEAYQTKCDV